MLHASWGPFLTCPRRCALAGISASRDPFFTCPRRCGALAEGCKYQPQHAGISACISGSVLHLSPEVCSCRRLQKRTAARRYTCMHLGVRSSPVPGGVHLQKAAKTKSTIRACISGSVPHLSPEECTCGRLQKRTAARRYKCMHLRVRSSPVPRGVHLQKVANTNRSTQV